MISAGWCAFMQAQLEKEQRQKEYEKRQAEKQAWRMANMSDESCPLCGGVMYKREG